MSQSWTSEVKPVHILLCLEALGSRLSAAASKEQPDANQLFGIVHEIQTMADTLAKMISQPETEKAA